MTTGIAKLQTVERVDAYVELPLGSFWKARHGREAAAGELVILSKVHLVDGEPHSVTVIQHPDLWRKYDTWGGRDRYTDQSRRYLVDDFIDEYEADPEGAIKRQRLLAAAQGEVAVTRSAVLAGIHDVAADLSLGRAEANVGVRARQRYPGNDRRHGAVLERAAWLVAQSYQSQRWLVDPAERREGDASRAFRNRWHRSRLAIEPGAQMTITTMRCGCCGHYTLCCACSGCHQCGTCGCTKKWSYPR